MGEEARPLSHDLTVDGSSWSAAEVGDTRRGSAGGGRSPAPAARSSAGTIDAAVDLRVIEAAVGAGSPHAAARAWPLL